MGVWGRATAVLVAVVAAGLAGCVGGGSSVDRGDYVKANESLFEQLPSFPGAWVSSESSSSYRDGEDGPVIGYVTRFELELPPEATPDTVGAFVLRRLRPEWRLVEELDGPVLNLRQGKASISISLESWRTHVLEVGVDHAFYDEPGPQLLPPRYVVARPSRLADAVADLKEQSGEDILIYGSSALVNTLMPRNLIDEYRFMIYPLVLGRGKRFFRDGNDKTTLALKRSETASTGVTMLVCEPQA